MQRLYIIYGICEMNVRNERPSDYQAISQINQLAFQGTQEAILIEKIRHSSRYIPELSLVAETDTVVGYVMFSYIDLVGEQTSQVLGLAPLAVLPQFQKQGIGSTLVNTGLQKAQKAGELMAIVLGDAGFYSRFGFEAAVKYNIESPFDVPDEAFMVKLLASYGQERGKVVYPPAFELGD